MANDFLRGIWRLAQPVRHTRGLKRLRLPAQYWRYLAEWKQFQAAGGVAPFSTLSPTLFDRDPSTQSGGGHYFFQDIWALGKLARAKPEAHHDVGSRLDGFVGQLTAICAVKYWDIRPPQFKLPRFEFCEGSIVKIPVPDGSIGSLSCLHTAEHIGLGRYGDPIDPLGIDKALSELQRILAPGGRLLFSMPVGVERTEFNAQRIWSPHRPIKQLAELELVEFSAVNDAGDFLSAVTPETVAGDQYACGLYEFRRKS